MPEIKSIAERTIPGAAIRIVPGEDDVPDVQRVFDLGRIKADLGWAPSRDIARGLAEYAAAIKAGQSS
jgi:nucleoside-diphosphate-sugar epimerase